MMSTQAAQTRLDPTTDMPALLRQTAERAVRYLNTVSERPIPASPEVLARLTDLHEPLPELPTDPSAVIARLDEIGSPATTATTGGRYFGFVIGGALPAAVAASWLATAWDQDGGMV
ncbi:MAG: aspartate aminotransferase family protein, partial [Dehalococcoidia bacterium]